MNLDWTSRLRSLVPFGAAATALLLLHAATGYLMASSQLDLGASLNLPTQGYGRFLAMWMLYAGLAAAALAWGLAKIAGAHQRAARWTEVWNHASDRKWILYTSIFAFLIPAGLRTFLLGGAPLTDDESAYRFMAEVLASGSVFAESPPLKLFFDNRFMVNDGKLYAHFFVGWPALLVPGVWLGVTGFMNSLYSALTVPALYASLRHLTDRAWARLGVVLYLASPMLMIAAATETAHTSCVAALAWFTWLFFKAREPGAPWWIHAVLAMAFCVAFFVRPLSALGIGLPFLVLWAWQQLRGRKARQLLAFVLPSLVLAALFLYVNKLQTGAWFEVAYQRAYTYAAENDFRFSMWPGPVEGGVFSELGFSSVERSLAITSAALFRLNITFLGWPCSLLFALFAGRGTLRSVLKLSVLCFLATHFFTNNVGIDTFAPMHFFELAWPLLLLTVCGLAELTRRLSQLDRQMAGWRSAVVPTATVAALVLTSLVSYVPVRFAAIERIAENIDMPQQAVLDRQLGPSVVFVLEPFIQYCRSAPAKGWVFARPNNSPQLDDHILWVNHLSIEKNRLLMRQQFADREGYVMAWDQSCRVVLLSLDDLQPGSLPDAPVSGIEQVGIT